MTTKHSGFNESLLAKGKQLSEMKQLFEMHCWALRWHALAIMAYVSMSLLVVDVNFQPISPIFLLFSIMLMQKGLPKIMLA